MYFLIAGIVEAQARHIADDLRKAISPAIVETLLLRVRTFHIEAHIPLRQQRLANVQLC